MSAVGISLSTLNLADSDDDVLFQPPSVIYPDRSSFSQALEVATRKLSIAHTRETNARYDLAYPLYLSCATGFLWAHRNVRSAGLQEDRLIKLRENLARQTQKALERAERIKAVKGIDWAKRFSGAQRRLDIESQAKVLHSSSLVNGVKFEPWLPYISVDSTSKSHPLPYVSARQRKNGAHFRRPSRARLWEEHEGEPHGKDITQDAVTNCGLVAAMQVVAQHDRQWKTNMLRRPFVSNSHGLHSIRLHFNGCSRHVLVDEQLPFISDSGADGNPGRLMCACLRNQADELILLPSLIEKAYLTILRSYAPPGSVPAEDLHALTAWLPEVIDLRQGSLQKEKTWQRIHRGWAEGRLLICAGTAAATAAQAQVEDEEEEQRMAALGPFGLVSAHSYAVLSLDTTTRTLTLMNPWRPADPGESSIKSSPFDMSWEDFCQHFATLHLAWNPIALFPHREEVHASWPTSPHTSASHQQGDNTTSASRIRNVAFTLRVTSDNSSDCRGDLSSTTPSEGKDEVWLHLSRHLTRTDQGTDDAQVRAPRRFIAIHVFEKSSSGQHTKAQQLDTRVVPLSSNGSSRNSRGDVYVDSAHHLIRFKPHFYLSSVLRSEQPGLASSQEPLGKDYEVVVSLHDGEDAKEGVNFTLRAWSTLPIALQDDDEEGEGSAARWETTVEGQWTESTSGGHQMTSTFHYNPQYLLIVPPNTPPSSISFTLTASPPSLPIHIYVLHSPSSSSHNDPQRVDTIEKASIVAESGPYAYGLTKARAHLPATPQGAAASYHVILSTYHAGTKGSFTLEMASKDVKVLLTQQRVIPLPGQVTLQHIPIEGAGMYHKRFKAAWDPTDGTAAGAPRFGHYGKNPTWVVRIGATDASSSSSVRCIFRLVVVAQQKNTTDEFKSTLPPINLSLFAETLAHEVATSGPYTGAPCGVAVHGARLQRGTEYLLVASTFQSGFHGPLDLLAWSEDRDWQVTRVV